LNKKLKPVAREACAQTQDSAKEATKETPEEVKTRGIKNAG
jgi:hypothetical protein